MYRKIKKWINKNFYKEYRMYADGTRYSKLVVTPIGCAVLLFIFLISIGVAAVLRVLIFGGL